MSLVHYPGTPGTVIYAGKSTPVPGSTLSTIQLVNETGSSQAANFVSPMFGVPFKQGEVPAGDYPQFSLENGIPCPATIWGVASWPDGSMKFCGAMIRVPAAVSAGGSLTIEIQNGGIAPAPSPRTADDLLAADIKVELTGVTNLSGLWTASLNDAIASASDVTVIGSGAAGKIWRIGGDCKQAGAAHGQLYCWHYVAALQNASGGLLGLRYLGRVAQPWVDVSTPTPTRRVVNAVLKVGASTLRTLQGHDTTETLGANIGFGHYTSFFTAGTDGKWDFVQGGGSATADCTIRVLPNKSYVSSSRLVPPYSLTETPTSSPSVDYYPYAKGSYATRDIDSTGPSNFIGIFPQWCVTHFMTQSAVDERAVRVSSLVSAGFRVCGRLSTTKQIAPVVDVQPSYAGLGTIQTGWRFSAPFYTGVQQPVDTTSLWTGDTNSSHRPNPHYYPYLITGEPQFLDLAVEQAATNIMGTDPGTYTRAVGSGISSLIDGAYSGLRNVKVGITGTTYKGAGIMYSGGGVRIAAWSTRDIAQTFALLPDIPPDGADVKGYFGDVLTSTYASVNDLNSKMPQSWRDAGLFSTNSQTAFSRNDDALYESPWMTMYLSLSICHQSQITGISEASTLRAHLSKFLSATHAQMDISLLSAYRWRQWKGDGTLVDSVGEVLFSNAATMTFDAGADTATVSGEMGAWSPTNGDKFAFTSNLDPDIPFAGAANGTTLHAVSSSGKSFKLATSPGGAAQDITISSVASTFFVQLQNAAPQLNFESGQYYISLAYEAARFHEACGDTNVAPARAKLDSNIAALSVSFTSDPRSALAPTYPG